MPRLKNPKDRFLENRGGRWYYKRRVPKRYAALDDRSPTIVLSLETEDLDRARRKRDLQARLDDELWASLVIGPKDLAWSNYEKARDRARALGFDFKTTRELIAASDWKDILDRIKVVEAIRHDSPRRGVLAAKAILGGVSKEETAVPVSEAFGIFVDKIAVDERLRKDAEQYASWKKVKELAIKTFVASRGDMDVHEITRATARAWHGELMARVEKGDIKPYTAQRRWLDFSNFWQRYMAYTVAEMDIDPPATPFRGFSFGTMEHESRPPFPTAWIEQKILVAGALDGMNDEARCILLMMVETGARPSEIMKLTRAQIHLTAKVPYIEITPVFDRKRPEGNRQIKSRSSKRAIPLVGVSLEATKRFPNGFPRYRTKTTTFSNTVNAYMERRGLLPTSKHSAYSFRHSLEKRMLEAGTDPEFRKLIMGHANKRPKYGDGGEMYWRRDRLQEIALPFDWAVVG